MEGSSAQAKQLFAEVWGQEMKKNADFGGVAIGDTGI